MADKELGSLTAAGALTGGEILHLVQSGNSRKAALSDIVTLSQTGRLAAADNLSDLASVSTARTNLGGTVTGIALFTAADAAAGRTTLDVYSTGQTYTQAQVDALVAGQIVRAAAYGVATGSASDQTTVLNSFFAACAGKVGYLPEGDYYFNPATVITIDGVILTGPATRFIVNASNTGSGECISVAAGAWINYLTLHIPTGLTINRGIYFNDGSGATLAKATSVDQQANTANNLHGAIQVRGDNVRISELSVSNFDYAGLCYQVDDTEIDAIKITSYVRGFRAVDTTNFRCKTFRTVTASANATTSPGNNGLLYEGVQNFSIDDVHIQGAGEHGARCGGGGTQQTKNVRIGRAHVLETGQCGWKIQDSTGTIPLNHTFGELLIEDCADTSTPGTNEDGFRAENATGIFISRLIVRKVANTYSAYWGCCFNGVRDVFISADISNTAADGIYFMQDATGLSYTPQKNGGITINGATVRTPGANFNCITAASLVRFDRIVWTSLDLRGQSGTGRSIVIPGATGTTGIDAKSVIHGWQENAGAGTHSLVADADLTVALTTY